MRARSRVTFIVESESLTAEEISRRLGLRPTQVTKQGDPVSLSRLHAGRRGHTTWALASPLNDDEEPAAHLEALLSIIEPLIPTLRQVEESGGNISWSCFVTAKPTGNMVWLEPHVLSRLARIGIALVLDIYDSDTD